MSEILKVEINDLREYKQKLVSDYVAQYNLQHLISENTLTGEQTEYFYLPEEAHED